MKCILVFMSFLIFNVNSKELKEEFTWTQVGFAPQTSPNLDDYSSKIYGGSGVGNKPGANRRSGYLSKTSTAPSSVNSTTHKNHYVFQNNIPMGANKWGNKLFITVPRRRLGVVSTLNYVWLNGTQRHNVPLIPYPNLEMNQLNTDRDGPHLVSVYRVAVDACDRLWMVDSGVIELPGNRTQIQPPALIIMDLHTNRIIRRYQFKPSDLGHETNLANIFIDVTRSACSDAFAYLPDLAAYALVVYSFIENDAWRITHNYFYLEPLAGDFQVGGHNFHWNDGIFSLGLSDILDDGYRMAYFHSMAGTHLYGVSTRVLRNRQLATRSYHGSDFQIIADRGSGSQASASDLHKETGVLFLGLVNQNALCCWNTKKSADISNFDIVFKDDKKFIYPCDIKIVGDDLIVLSNTMPVFLYGRLDYNEVNFRVWITPVQDVIRGTVCDMDNDSLQSINPLRREYGRPTFIS